jgi:peptide/nickel transport system substrate-binding protein
VIALDAASRSVIERISSDLVHIDRDSHKTRPSLAKSWTVSTDGRIFTLHLRRGIRFSDGHPFDADDVVFTFQVHLDEKLQSPQRDLLIAGGKAISVRKLDEYTVRFELSQPYAAAERLFDSIAILPEHLLRPAYEQGKLAQSWGLGTPPAGIAGLGPFVLKEHVPGQRITLSRNPHYWVRDRKGQRLPYLDELVLVFVGSEDAQALRFQSGEADVVSRLSSENFALIEKDAQSRGNRLYDLGPSLEYHFLFFNMNDLKAKNLPAVQKKQRWFRDIAFRRAVSAAVDREAIVRLVYRGRATALTTHVTPGNKLWLNSNLKTPERSVAQSRAILSKAGYSWRSDGRLLDPEKQPVEFTILAGSGNAQRKQIATIVQDDLKQVGMRAEVVSLESRAAIDRVFNTLDYDAAVMALAGGDADPNVEVNVWLSRGATHLWQLPSKDGKAAIEPWQAEIDSLMEGQMTAINRARRKQMYDRVQELVAENLPVISLVSPNVLVGAKADLGNLRPAILSDYVLWNAEQIFWRSPR